MIQHKGRPLQRDEEEHYQQNMTRAKLLSQLKMLLSTMLLLITFTNNQCRPTSSQVQAEGWSKSPIQGQPSGVVGKCPCSTWAAWDWQAGISGADPIRSIRKYRFQGMVLTEIMKK